MPLLGALLLALALALLCSWGLAHRRDTARPRRPRSLPALPLVGSLLQLAGHPQLHLRLWRLQGRYGSLYALWMGSHYVVVVNSYRHAREVLLKKGKAFAGRPRTVSRQRGLREPLLLRRGVRRGMRTREGLAPGRVLLLFPFCLQQWQWQGQPPLCPVPRGKSCASSIPRGPVFPRGWLHFGAWVQVPPRSLHPPSFLGTPVPNPGICSQTSPSVFGVGKQSSWPWLCPPALTTIPGMR